MPSQSQARSCDIEMIFFVRETFRDLLACLPCQSQHFIPLTTRLIFATTSKINSTMTEEAFLDSCKREQKVVLHDLFDGQVSPQSAATKLAAVTLPVPLPDLGEEDKDEDEAEEALAHIEGMWHNIISSLEEAPEHAKTVCDLTICMSQLQPALAVSGDQLCDSEPR